MSEVGMFERMHETTGGCPRVAALRTPPVALSLIAFANGSMLESGPTSAIQFDSVLFLGVGNATRSQIAEGLARELFGPSIRIESAGSSPSHVDPLAIQVMAELDIDLSTHTPKSVPRIDPANIDLVITLCSDAEIPAALDRVPRLHWPLEDPDHGDEKLTRGRRLHHFRLVRDQLRARLTALAALRYVPDGLAPQPHVSMRILDLRTAARFYTRLLGVAPTEWTESYVTFSSESIRPHLVAHDTVYQLRIDVGSPKAVLAARRRVAAAGWPIHATGSPIPSQELWLTDPAGNAVEIYASATDEERAVIVAPRDDQRRTTGQVHQPGPARSVCPDPRAA